jgi:hypothetical protein
VVWTEQPASGLSSSRSKHDDADNPNQQCQDRRNKLANRCWRGPKEAKKNADTRSGHEQSTESEQNPTGKEETEPDARFVDFQAIVRLEFVRHIVLSFFGSSRACEGRGLTQFGHQATSATYDINSISSRRSSIAAPHSRIPGSAASPDVPVLQHRTSIGSVCIESVYIRLSTKIRWNGAATLSEVRRYFRRDANDF